MDDDEMYVMDAGEIELERRFDAFARARLSPDSAARARVRARVLREAALHHEAARIALHMAPAIEARHRSSVRRLGVPLLAASVWLGIAAGSIAAAQAGGPLYPTRMWLETATLPASGDARATADLQHLDARLGEAIAAATRGDRDAAAAALEAYAETAEDARANALDPGVAAQVESALEHHVAVLTAVADGLAAKGNDTAANAIGENIQRAIAHSATVLDTLANHQGGPDEGNGNGSGGGNANGGGTGTVGGGGNGGGGGPAETPRGNGGGAAGGGGGAGGTSSDPTPTTEPVGQPTSTPKPGNPGGPDKPDKPQHTPRGPH
jgi:hypothetical protein